MVVALPFIGIMLYVLMAAAWIGILGRLGWNKWWGLATLLPGGFLVPLAMLYFQRWPLERKIKDLEEEIEWLRLQRRPQVPLDSGSPSDN